MSKYYYTGSRDNEVAKIEKATGTVVDTYAGSTGVRALAIDKARLWVCFDDGSVHEIDVSDMSLVRSGSTGESTINSVTQSSDSIFCGCSGVVVQMSKDDLSVEGSYSGHTGSVWGVIYQDGALYSCDSDGNVHKTIDLSLEASYSDTDRVFAVAYGGGHVWSWGDTRQVRQLDPSDLSLVDSFSGTYDGGTVSNGRGLIYVNGNLYGAGESARAVFRFNAETKSIERLDTGFDWAISTDGERFFATTAVGSNSRAYKFDASVVSTTSYHSSRVYGLAVESSIEVPDDEEAFTASFEDASGRDPLPTALIERSPAKRLANHNVIVYRYPPYMVTKRVPIELADYPKTLPGKMLWHKDENDALFLMGRWAQIQGRRFTDNPFEVELTLRISDHPESFEEPS